MATKIKNKPAVTTPQSAPLSASKKPAAGIMAIKFKKGGTSKPKKK